MKKLISNKNLFALTFVIIIVLGIFLRFFHLHNWMHFELDQARDAKIVYTAIEEGPGELPLLGPRAAGTFLRLGPAFYYMEYLSALFFPTYPSGTTVIIAILSILSLPLFYLFVNRYFSKKVSLGILLIFSVSVFLVIYARFPWNPNTIPFFALLLFYSLLRVVANKEKKKHLWIYTAAFALALGTQLHFLALVSFSLITIIFLLIKRPKIKLKHWAAAILIILFFLFTGCYQRH